jgi:hypothetical protein
VSQIGVVVSLVLIFAASACAASPLERSDLEADPASRIRMPGADVLTHVADERHTSIEGPQPPFEGFIFGTMSSRDAVYAFYEAELARLGWKREPRVLGRSTVELDLREYCKPKVFFRLAIKDKARAFRPEFYGGRDYVTVFDARLVGVDPTGKCPSDG